MPAPLPALALDPADNLREEMSRVKSLLRTRLLASAQPGGKLGPAAEFAGLYVSEDEVRRALGEDGPGVNGSAHTSANCPYGDRSRARPFSFDPRVGTFNANGEPPRLSLLATRFGLSDTELRILSVCLAPDVDVTFHRLFAYLQNDVAKKRPCVQFLAGLWDDLREVREARALLNPDAPLIRHRLLVLPARAPGQDLPIPLQQPVVASTVVDFLFGRDRIDERLAGCSSLVEPRRMPSFGTYDRHHHAIRDCLLAFWRTRNRLPLTYLGGPPGSLRGRLAEQLASDTGKRLLRVRAKTLGQPPEALAENLGLLGRDATLHDALIHLEGLDEALGDDARASTVAAGLQTWLTSGASVPVIVSGTRSVAEMSPALGVPFRGFDLPHPSIQERAEIWSALLQGEPGEASRRLIDGLAAKFRFTPGQIQAAISAAAAPEAPDDRGATTVRIEDLHRSCREASNQRLLAYAQKLTPRYDWDDIVLPFETTRQLREITGLVRHRCTVYGQWGFEAKFSVGNGVAVLFAGPSGTGKTMSAEIIAGDLELDLYKLDLSCVVSKYVGETERNLDKIFDEAETSNSILFFDEADALFGKRSEVKDAHDRYANIEINYLLQKLDDYLGIIILATNFKGNLDTAFTRRLNYIVDFPTPDVSLRRQIWGKVFPAEVPLAPDVDFDFLARKFELSGGHIKNIALNGAFLAASEQGTLQMAHLIRATKREFQKLGRLCSKSEFGPYLGLVRSEPEA